MRRDDATMRRCAASPRKEKQRTREALAVLQFVNKRKEDRVRCSSLSRQYRNVVIGGGGGGGGGTGGGGGGCLQTHAEDFPCPRRLVNG